MSTCRDDFPALSAWHAGPQGKLSPWSLAKLWALHALSGELEIKLSSNQMAAKLEKIGGGRPSSQCVEAWRHIFDSDADWYPGKAYRPSVPSPSGPSWRGGRPKVMTQQQEAAIAKSAMSLKARGIEPTARNIAAQCPKATLNPETGAPFTPKVIHAVLGSKCYDNDPEYPWQQLPPKNKSALSEAAETFRAAWAGKLLDEAYHRADWYYNHIVWFDPSSNIIHGSVRAQFDAGLATFGKGKRWMSTDSRNSSRNLRAAPYAGKQKQWSDEKHW